MQKGRTDFAGCTTFTNAKKFAAYLRQLDYHTAPVELNHKHIKENRARVARNPSLSSAIQTRVTHLTSGGVKVQDGALALLGLRREDINKQYATFAGELEWQHYTQGVGFLTASSAEERSPIVLKPED